jgi:hypothetical protein
MTVHAYSGWDADLSRRLLSQGKLIHFNTCELASKTVALMHFFDVQVETRVARFWRALAAKMLIYFRAIWNILRIFYDHSVYFVFICYIFSGFGIMNLEKSGNPGGNAAVFHFRGKNVS